MSYLVFFNNEKLVNFYKINFKYLFSEHFGIHEFQGHFYSWNFKSWIDKSSLRIDPGVAVEELSSILLFSENRATFCYQKILDSS